MNINFTKYADGLVPAIVQDANTKTVLMLGFMSQAAVDATLFFIWVLIHVGERTIILVWPF